MRLEIDFARNHGCAPMPAFDAFRAAFQRIERHRGAARVEILHHQDRIGFDGPPAPKADDPQVVAAPRALIDRIEFMSDHAPMEQGGNKRQAAHDEPVRIDWIDWLLAGPMIAGYLMLLWSILAFFR